MEKTNLKISTTTAIIGFIAAYLSVLAPILTFVLGDASVKKDIKDFINSNIILTGLIGFLLLLFPILCIIAYNLIIREIHRRKLKRRKFSNFIVEKQEIVIDITNSGKTAHYWEKTVFCNLGNRKKNPYDAEMVLKWGTIEPVSAFNCAYNLHAGKQFLSFHFIDNVAQLNNYPSIIKEQDKFCMFSAILHDCFINKTESWDLMPKHYCRSYNLQVNLPVGVTLAQSTIQRVTLDNNNNEIITVLHDIVPVVTQINGRYNLTMHIVDYDYPDTIRLEWEII